MITYSSIIARNTLTTVRKLLEDLNASGTRYCHWKSNSSLAEALSGDTDIDLLVHRNDADLFRTILGQLDFRPAISTDGESFPAVEHYYALDEESDSLVHLHAYYRTITGESLTKNYRFPIEDMLLQNTREENSVRVPTKSAELVVFTLRMMLKHTSLMELVLVARYWKQVRHEIKWLLEGASIDETLNYVNCHLPTIDTGLFADCITALATPAPILRRILLGRRLRSQLRTYTRRRPIRAWLSGVQKFTIMFARRLTKSPKGMIPRAGGAVIAFVGPEATGKTTLLAETRGWLGEHFAVRQIHVGKPKSTPLSAIPNVFVPALRSLLPASRSTRVETQYGNEKQPKNPSGKFPLIFGIRSVLLAYDRLAMISKAYRNAANGMIVLCDRYPSTISGAPDSPQLSHLPVPAGRFSIRRRLVELEAKLYRKMPPPDQIIYLRAPLEVTLMRNGARGKVEPEDYVRRRHARSSSLEFGKTPVHDIDTNQPLDRTTLLVKKAVWNAL